MDFYRYQDQAKKLSTRLLILFFAGLISLSAALTLAGLFLWQLTDQVVHIDTNSQFWHWYIIGNVAIFAALVLITLLKYSSLCKGGRVVAEALGARYVHINTQDTGDIRLRNVVEEMALAAGMPVPSVYVLDEEPGINAFAAGMGINDAVVVVTQGAISYLTRDELQAVVAHEFSHIQHGDIRLNQQLAALIGSLMFLGELGRWLSQGTGRHRIGSSQSKSSSALPFFGLTLMLLGAAGTFWGKLMKSALNRQREFLADASAVQFTRYAAPLASALKKVGGHRYASLIFHPQAETFSHLFFSQGLSQNFRGWLASHPPLQDRIRRSPEMRLRVQSVAPRHETGPNFAAGQEPKASAFWPNPLPIGSRNQFFSDYRANRQRHEGRQDSPSRCRQSSRSAQNNPCRKSGRYGGWPRHSFQGVHPQAPASLDAAT